MSKHEVARIAGELKRTQNRGIAAGYTDRRVAVHHADGKTTSEWLFFPESIGDVFEGWHPYIMRGNVIVQPIAWLPLPGSQVKALDCPYFEVLYEGTRGPGKSSVLLADFARDVNQGYGNKWRGVIFRCEYGELGDLIAKADDMYYKMFGSKGYKIHGSSGLLRCVFPGGEYLLFRAIDRVEKYKHWHGQEFPWLGFDELTNFKDQRIYLQLFSCCRTDEPGIRRRVRASTNPSGVGHNWVKKRFQLPHMRWKAIGTGIAQRVAIPGKLDENFVLAHTTPGYRETLIASASSNAQLSAWLDGDWNITSGGMFDDIWEQDIHVIPPIPVEQIPVDWGMYRAYDHGQATPFALGWWLQSNGEAIEVEGQIIGAVKGDVIQWHEFYGNKGEEANVGIEWSSLEIGKEIAKLEKTYGIADKVQAGPADTQIWVPDRNRQKWSPADDMAQSGIHFTKADKSPGSRKRGWEKIRSLLKGAVPNEEGFRENPGLFITRNSSKWLELVPTTTRDTKDIDEIVMEKDEDHIHDMTRYFVTSRSGRAQIINF